MTEKITKNRNQKRNASEKKEPEKTVTDELTAVLEEIVEEPKAEKVKGEIVTPINETDFMVGNRQYKLVKDYREGFDAKMLGERYSEVLARYDYVVGDWGYEKLRLKGFFAADNRKAAPEQRIDTLEDYLYEFCNFGCAYFVIQRIGGKKEKSTARRRNKKSNSGGNNQAHIAEKREAIKSKAKPVIRKNQPAEKNKPEAAKKRPKPVIKQRTTEKSNHPPTNQKSGFTIRQREE